MDVEGNFRLVLKSDVNKLGLFCGDGEDVTGVVGGTDEDES